ncbi:hypothetical protein NQ317_005724 [Molorchus minor]|uniref:Uncharacterized protein n=1 Tax=Molorchus minor TaxID=1323400 RepID=A0ABQ9J973_9CUCU|nr:hypothetical protein NQ317_005724 [Molorchus minor]
MELISDNFSVKNEKQFMKFSYRISHAAELISDNFFLGFTHVFVDRKFPSSSTRDNFRSTKNIRDLEKKLSVIILLLGEITSENGSGVGNKCAFANMRIFWSNALR